jgi:endogenous inhibitor of DNA gyrase (YacG/DUF329 family)
MSDNPQRVTREVLLLAAALLFQQSPANDTAAAPFPDHRDNSLFKTALDVECSHCHDEGQWTSSSKAPFATARKMAAMVVAVNTRLGELGKVTCTTCHRGGVRPARSPAPALEDQLAKWPDSLREASEGLRITMSVYNVALGVTCEHCHDPADWKSSEKRPFKTTAVMNGLFKEFPKYMPASARTQCYMCHQGSRKPEGLITR